jgi:hypothetical protein
MRPSRIVFLSVYEVRGVSVLRQLRNGIRDEDEAPFDPPGAERSLRFVGAREWKEAGDGDRKGGRMMHCEDGGHLCTRGAASADDS